MEHYCCLPTATASGRAPRWLAGLGLVLMPTAVLAQNPQATQQVDAVQQRQAATAVDQNFNTNTVPELYPGETSDVGIQSVLTAKPWRPILEGSADEQYFYTDNALYTTHHLQGSDVLVSTIQATLTAPPVGLGEGFLTPRLAFQQQWFNYGLVASGNHQEYDFASQEYVTKELGDLDFSAQTVILDGTWRWNNWLLTPGVDYRRLLDPSTYDQFYTELVPRWGVQRLFNLSPTTGLSLSYQGTYRVTDTTKTTPALNSSSGNRTDESLMLAGSWKLREHLIVQPYYSFVWSHYTSIDRDDLLNSVGLGINCPLGRQVNLRFFVAYDNFNTSGKAVQAYENLTAGAGVNLTVTF